MNSTFRGEKLKFGATTQNNFTMIESEIEDIPQLSDEENKILSNGFTKKEVYEAIM
jgi:hypothetical protein